jgi:hypothetical protein
MTTGEWITLTVAIGSALMIFSAIASYWSSGNIGWKVVLLELLLTGAIAACCFYFMPHYDEDVLRKRYRKEVIQEVWKCQERCARQCLKYDGIGGKE